MNGRALWRCEGRWSKARQKEAEQAAENDLKKFKIKLYKAHLKRIVEA